MVEVLSGDVLLMPWPDSDEIYSVKGHVFNATYSTDVASASVTAAGAASAAPYNPRQQNDGGVLRRRSHRLSGTVVLSQDLSHLIRQFVR